MTQPSLRQNLEIKFRVPDLRAVREKALGIGATYGWKRSQEDIFFRVRRGRLKLRLEGDRAELIAYFRDDLPEARESSFVIVPCPDPTAMRSALSATLGEIATVRKRRGLYRWRNVRIHFDEVEGLGQFVELESVVSAGVDFAEARRNLETVRTALGLDAAQPVPVAYVDLLIASREGAG